MGLMLWVPNMPEVALGAAVIRRSPCAAPCAAAAAADDSDRYCHIPRNLEEQLMPFQREGVRFALRHGGRVLIGDEMVSRTGLEGTALAGPALLAGINLHIKP